MTVSDRQRGLLRAIRQAGSLSRTQLHRATGIRRNTVYEDVDSLIVGGYLREGAGTTTGRGRPQAPLEIDPQARCVIGLSIGRHELELCRLTLTGEPEGTPRRRTFHGASSLQSAGAELLRGGLDERVVAVGISAPGFVDRERQTLVFSAAVPREGAVGLQALTAAAGDHPVVIGNDVHAQAAQWLLTHAQAQAEDLLLVYLGDGRMGAAAIVGGRPLPGCVGGANELGHTRLPVETDRCYCGHRGCLERVFSTGFLRAQGVRETLLSDLVLADRLDEPALRRSVELTALGIASAVNFMRPSHLVLATDLPSPARLLTRLSRKIEEQLLGGLAGRVAITPWEGASARSGVTAGWLALAQIFLADW